ncbi:cytochrome P450 [Mycena albidolilacea]|uniref:Cytochrome P450 n=1 Tax=Mycena albidolilacea TaxID=1033008 RepID=A0AAD7AQT4_9AGAR|nr:cytochrome P450 [Mycena albidolilacea]
MAHPRFEQGLSLNIQQKNDPYIKIAYKALEYLTEAATPGAFLFNVFPSLKLVPEWFPGAAFKTKAKKWRVPVTKVPTEPFNAAKRSFEAGKDSASLTSSWLDKLPQHPDAKYCRDMEKAIRNVGGTAYVGGFETTASSDPNAYPNIPTLRTYRTSRATEDNIMMYKGMLIPKGCIVLCNQWLVLRNEKAYGPDPDTFNPERFLKPGVPDLIAAFGFGFGCNMSWEISGG